MSEFVNAVARDAAHRRSWPYVNAPAAVFFAVIGPICAMMIVLLIVPQREWVKVTAAGVLAVSGYAALRGYARRLIIDERGATFRGVGRSHTIAWVDVRRVERYIPSGAVNGTRYVYVTAHDRAPRGVWEIDSKTLQLQDRPGLLEALQAAWLSASRTQAR